MRYPRRLALIAILVFGFLIFFLSQSLRYPSYASTRADGRYNGPIHEATTAWLKEGTGAHNVATDQLSKVVIIARTQEEDIEWLHRDLPEVKKAIYTVDNASADLTVPANKGHEGMVYLTYILDNYDDLPDVMIFLHAHQIAWHNNDLLGSDAVNMIRSLSAPHVKRQGYFNMRCHWDPGCPDWLKPYSPSNRTDISKPEERELAEAFAEIWPGREIPETVATPCCAQFALSREAVLRHPKPKIESYRRWLLDTELSDTISGRVWEYLWHYVFSEFNPIVCQAMDVCYCDGFGLCFGGKEQFNNFTSTRNEMRKMEISLQKWQKEYEDDGTEMTEGAEGVYNMVTKKIGELKDIIVKQIEEARIRGLDPRLRAHDVGRAWKPGAGY